jgi:hypothetical protein
MTRTFDAREERRDVMANKPGVPGSEEARKYCAKCATLMVLERVMPKFGPLPEIRTYRCLRCGAIVDETLHR